MDILKLSIQDEGKTFIIRPLPNIKNLQKSILLYKHSYNKFQFKWSYRYMCFSMINGELKIFDFSKAIRDKMFLDKNVPMFFMNSNKAIKITVGVKEGFIDPACEIISDDKYQYDNTEEKRKFIKNLLESTNLDLFVAIEKSKSIIENRTVEIPYGPASANTWKTKTLREIYAEEGSEYKSIIRDNKIDQLTNDSRK